MPKKLPPIWNYICPQYIACTLVYPAKCIDFFHGGVAKLNLEEINTLYVCQINGPNHLLIGSSICIAQFIWSAKVNNSNFNIAILT